MLPGGVRRNSEEFARHCGVTLEGCTNVQPSERRETESTRLNLHQAHLYVRPGVRFVRHHKRNERMYKSVKLIEIFEIVIICIPKCLFVEKSDTCEHWGKPFGQFRGCERRKENPWFTCGPSP